MIEETVRALDADLALVVLAGSPLVAWARAARTVAEAFADRGYRADGQPGAAQPAGRRAADPDAVAERMVQLVRTGTIGSERWHAGATSN